MRLVLRQLLLSVAMLVGLLVIGAYSLQGRSVNAQETALAFDVASEAEVYAYVIYEDGTKEPVPATYDPYKSLKDMVAGEGVQGSESHPVPDVPVIVDGVFYEDPTVLNELFIGKKLRYIADEKAEKEGVIYVFSTVDGYFEYIKKYWGIDPDKPGASDPQEYDNRRESTVNPAAAVWSKYWWDCCYGGTRFEVLPGASVPTLYSSNNEITSLQIGPDTAISIMYDNTNYSGDSLTKYQNESSWLLVFMNDRIESIQTAAVP